MLDNAYSIGTVVGTAIGCVLFTILVMGIVVYLILKRRKNITTKKSGKCSDIKLYTVIFSDYIIA